MRLTPRAAAALGALATALAVLVPATPASADEVFARPADGVFTFAGHGWGHGQGMSQYGAEGAASLGVSADTITATYYPGTQRAVLPDAPLRVLLTGAAPSFTEVYAAAGLTLTDLATGSAQTLPDGPTRWRVAADATGLHVSALTGSTWGPFGASSYAGPLRFAGPAFVRVAYPDGTSRDYRGAVQSVAAGSAVRTVAVLGMEDYLLGVVPREMPSSWLPAALQAQAIAARSYAAYARAHAPAGAAYDICDSTACQVFGGSTLYAADGTSVPLEAAGSSDAVRATAGVVRTFSGQPIFAAFSSSNGGWSTAGSLPYLVARQDDWDGVVASSVHSWTARLPASVVEARWPQLGTLREIRVTARDGNGEWGGRVTSVVLVGADASGAATSVTTTGQAIYALHPWPAYSDGLRSSWWEVTSVGAAPARPFRWLRAYHPPGSAG